jgi:hypothetical protein
LLMLSGILPLCLSARKAGSLILHEHEEQVARNPVRVKYYQKVKLVHWTHTTA